jgi:hypothetical protein
MVENFPQNSQGFEPLTQENGAAFEDNAFKLGFEMSNSKPACESQFFTSL